MAEKLKNTTRHFLDDVLSAAGEYEKAEAQLTLAYGLSSSEAGWSDAASIARRKAAVLAVTIDGLSDRAANELGRPIGLVRSQVSQLCVNRPGCLERVGSVANAYKHGVLIDARNVIQSEDDILTVGLGFGLDGYGIGKFDGVEVMIREKTGAKWKFLGDIPAVVTAWFHFLVHEDAELPKTCLKICGVKVFHNPSP